MPRTFSHGVHPEEHKEATAHLALERMPFVSKYTVPLSQHTGAPARAVVAVGDRVERGQVIAEPGGFVSTTLHAPVAGRIVAIAPRPHPLGKLVEAIEIEADPFSPQRLTVGEALDPVALDNPTFVTELQRAGLVGMGGAAFPTHVKYRLPEGRKISRLLVNGCECEPFLTADHRLMVEQAAEIVRGAVIAAARLAVEETVFGVEINKPDAIAALRQAVEGHAAMRVVPLAVKYPQGAEKMLIQAIYGLEVPSGKLPLDVGVLVNNVATMIAIADWFDRRLPLVERVVTVAGPGVHRPANLIVPVGTPVRDVLDFCGGLSEETREIVMGGPMMGTPLASLDVPVLKGTSGLLAFTEAEARMPTEYTCIKCGRCVEACPQFLNPSRLARLSRAGMYDEMVGYHGNDCVECGACSFACPSGIPIVQLIRVAKGVLRTRPAAAPPVDPPKS
jgi:electron transport complex protein RnfC